MQARVKPLRDARADNEWHNEVHDDLKWNASAWPKLHASKTYERFRV